MQEQEDKKPEKWIRFCIGDVFPANEVLARWISGLNLILNDLLQLNNQLLCESAKDEKQDTPEEAFMFYLTCALYREAVKFLEVGNCDATIASFIKSLPPDAQECWRSIMASFTPWEGSFVQSQVKPVRDSLFHYPSPHSDEWASVLAHLAQRQSGIRFQGNKFRDIRSVFADELRHSLLMAHLGKNHDEVGYSVNRMSLLVVQLLRFGEESVAEFLKTAPQGTLEFDPEEA